MLVLTLCASDCLSRVPDNRFNPNFALCFRLCENQKIAQLKLSKWGSSV